MVSSVFKCNTIYVQQYFPSVGLRDGTFINGQSHQACLWVEACFLEGLKASLGVEAGFLEGLKAFLGVEADCLESLGVEAGCLEGLKAFLWVETGFQVLAFQLVEALVVEIHSVVVEVVMAFLLMEAERQVFQWVEHQEMVWVYSDHQGVAEGASCCHHLYNGIHNTLVTAIIDMYFTDHLVQVYLVQDGHHHLHV